MKTNKLLLFCFVLPLFSYSQEEESSFGIKFSGYVKNDVFYDSRQTVDFREGHFLLYPQNIKTDVNAKDINAIPNFNMLAIQTRLTGNITGPDAFGAKTSGIIEGQFFGNSDADIDGFSLRHAFVKLNWKNTEILAGQFWHPLFIDQAFPEVISFNTGAPFLPFSRNPQIRLTKKIDRLSISATAYAQRDYSSTGAKGISNIYMRNAAIPATNLLLSYLSEKSNMFGIGADYKIIVPELETSKGFKTTESLGSLSGTVFSKITFNKFTWKLQATVAQNAYDITMLGGYAIKNTNYDTLTGLKEFTNYTTASAWTELYAVMGKFTASLFAGYTKNIGTDYNILPGSTVYARGADIAYIYRVAPRFMITHQKVTVGLEVEYTTAGYGNKINSLGEVTTITDISNIRGLLSFIYKF